MPTKKGPNGTISVYTAAEAFELMAAAMSAEINQLIQSLRAHDIWVWPGGAIEVHLGIGKNDAARVSFLNTAVQNGNLNHATSPQDLLALAHWI
jgi:putative ATP-dependent endonuclease of OLD family